MITSRLPIWRTNPAGFDKARFWPGATGALTVLFFIPLLGFLLQAIFMMVFDRTSPIHREFHDFTGLLIASPLLSWAALLVAVPMSALLAKKGYAGWGIATLMGAVAGFVGLLLIEGEIVGRADDTIAFVGVGVILALAYWWAIRMMHPTSIGVDFNPSSS